MVPAAIVILYVGTAKSGSNFCGGGGSDGGDGSGGDGNACQPFALRTPPCSGSCPMVPGAATTAKAPCPHAFGESHQAKEN